MGLVQIVNPVIKIVLLVPFTVSFKAFLIHVSKQFHVIMIKETPHNTPQ